MRSQPRILVVDDEPDMQRMLRLNLSRHGYDVEEVGTGVGALGRVNVWHPDIVILDLGLPDVDGLDIVREIRSNGSNTRIVVLSVRSSDRDKVAALDLGADDYLSKPFSLDELVARVRVALRHAGSVAPSSTQVFGDLVVRFDRRQVVARGQDVNLSPIEWELLKAFIAAPNRVLTYRTLLRQVWGPSYSNEEHYLHVYVSHLRRKIEEQPRSPRYLMTESGVGYRFQCD